MYSDRQTLINEILRNGFINTCMYDIDDKHMLYCVAEAYNQVDVNIAPNFKNELELKIYELLYKLLEKITK